MTSISRLTVFTTVLFLTNTANFQTALAQTPPTRPAATTPPAAATTPARPATRAAPVTPAVTSAPPQQQLVLSTPTAGQVAEAAEVASCGTDTTSAAYRTCIRGIRMCPNLETSLRTAQEKAAAACSAARLPADSCLEKAKSCSDAGEDEVDTSSLISSVANAAAPELNFNGAMMNPGEYRGRCMTKNDFRDEKKSIEDKLEKADKKISDANKDITKTQEEAEKDKRKLQESLQELNKSAREEDLQAKDNERKSEQDMQKAQLEAQQRTRQLQIEVLQGQAQLAKILGERTRTLAKLTNAMIQKNCMEALEKVKSGMKKIQTGAAHSVIRQNSEVRRRLKMDYDSCLKEMQSMRETTREESANNVAAAEQMIDGKSKEVQELQQSFSMASQQNAAAKAEREQSKTQTAQERMSKMQLLQQEHQTITAATQQKILQIQQDLAVAQQNKNKASNEMATLGSKSAGSKAPEDAEAAMSSYASAKRACERVTTCNCAVGTGDGIDSAPASAPAPGGRR